MDSWDSKMVLDKYVYNYMKKRNLHTTAEIFRAEADISPNAVSIDSDEGFLREWWHVFWGTYISRTTKTHEHKEVPPQNPLVPSSDSNPMFDMCPAMPPGFEPLAPRVSPSVMVPRPGIFPGRSDFPRMMPTPGFSFPTSSLNAPSGMRGNGTLTLPNRDFYSNSPFLNANQLDRHMLPSSSNSYPSQRVYKNPQLCLTKDDKCGVGYLPIAGRIKIGSSDTVPQNPVPVPGPGPAALIPVADVRAVREQDQFRFPANFNPESDCSHAKKNKKRQICVTRLQDNKCAALEPKTEPRDISDASIAEQAHFGDPQMDLYPNSQILNVSQLSRMLSSPTKFNYPHQNAYKKKAQCCANSDKRLVGTTSRRPDAAELTHQEPEAILQLKSELAESGSSASSNSRSSGFGPSS